MSKCEQMGNKHEVVSAGGEYTCTDVSKWEIHMSRCEQAGNTHEQK